MTLHQGPSLQDRRLAQSRALARERLWRAQQERLWECAVVWERLAYEATLAKEATEMEAQQAAQA